jgi:hypothetical protein
LIVFPDAQQSARIWQVLANTLWEISSFPQRKSRVWSCGTGSANLDPARNSRITASLMPSSHIWTVTATPHRHLPNCPRSTSTTGATRILCRCAHRLTRTLLSSAAVGSPPSWHVELPQLNRHVLLSGVQLVAQRAAAVHGTAPSAAVAVGGAHVRRSVEV